MLFQEEGGWTEVRADVIAIEADGARLTALVREAAGCVLARTLGGPEWDRWAEAPGTWAGGAMLAARSDVVAIANESGSIACSFDAGRHWDETRVPPTLCCIGVAAGQVVGISFVESEDKSYLFAIGQDHEPRIVAEIVATGAALDPTEDESEGLGRASALAWDEARGCLWVVGNFGLRGFKPGRLD